MSQKSEQNNDSQVKQLKKIPDKDTPQLQNKTEETKPVTIEQSTKKPRRKIDVLREHYVRINHARKIVIIYIKELTSRLPYWEVIRFRHHYIELEDHGFKIAVLSDPNFDENYVTYSTCSCRGCGQIVITPNRNTKTLECVKRCKRLLDFGYVCEDCFSEGEWYEKNSEVII